MYGCLIRVDALKEGLLDMHGLIDERVEKFAIPFCNVIEMGLLWTIFLFNLHRQVSILRVPILVDGAISRPIDVT